ncbi:MAG: DUF433 domain-containing protein [Acidobacteria bacterium]|nr:DUF433 domain-containing protein [Acidobacteriota bacterium]
MTRKKLISQSKDILSGTPVFAGTRVPIQALFDYLKGGDRLDDFLDDFPTVTRAQAEALLELMKESVLSPTR